jgi:ribosome-associated toxin RatA of RatAB toxin-antitoxin module
MIHISRNALLPYPVQQIFELINDVSAYPQYMEGCTGAEVIRRQEDFMEARLDLSKAGLKYSFTTHNRLEPPHAVIMELVDGPFSDFAGRWQLTPLGDSACKVSLDLHFKLKHKVLGKAAKVLFKPMADNLVDALVTRAHHLHRPAPASG